MVREDIKRIVEVLEKDYGVTDDFYPGISITLDLPKGLEGEVNEIVSLLQRNGFDVTAENVFHVMKFKRQLLFKYTTTEKGKKIYNDLRDALRSIL